jgi:hypothetical protein
MSCRIQTIDGPLVIPNAGPEHCENVWGEAFDKKTHIVYAVAVSQKDAISCARNNEYSEVLKAAQELKKHSITWPNGPYKIYRVKITTVSTYELKEI